MDKVEELEQFYFKFGEEEVNFYLISQLKVYSLSWAIDETINYFKNKEG